MNVILSLARVTLAVGFGISGIVKVADPVGFRKSIADFGVQKSLAIPLVWLLPLAELACASALIPRGSASWGAIGVLILLLSFIAAISASLIGGRRPDCHCFGQLHSSPIGLRTLVRNVVLAEISAWIVLQGRENPGASIVSLARGMSATGSALTALAIDIAGLAGFEFWALVHVLRQNGRLQLRLEAVEAKFGGVVEAPLRACG